MTFFPTERLTMTAKLIFGYDLYNIGHILPLKTFFTHWGPLEAPMH